MNDVNWRDAIIRVLSAEGEPMHYKDIAEAIAEQELRTEFGATPAATVDHQHFQAAHRKATRLRPFSST